MTMIAEKQCECGCGLPAPVSHKNDARQGYVKGQPRRFVRGHATRGKPVAPETRRKNSLARRGEKNYLWKGDEAGYVPIHRWLRRWHPKTGVCEECGANVGAVGQRGTHYAFKHHPEPHTRDIADYRELCPTCHKNYDNARRSP